MVRGTMANPERMRKVRQTMARIKTVLNERRNLHKRDAATSDLRELLRTELIMEQKRAEIDVLVEQAREDPNIDLEELKEKYLKEEYARVLEAREVSREKKKQAEIAAEEHRKHLNDLAGRPTQPRPDRSEEHTT